MTPCEKLGYKVGDEFETLEGSNYFKIGERVKLEKDDGSYLPRFTNGKKSRHLYLDNVRPLRITLAPGDYVSTDGITDAEYHAVAAAFMGAGAEKGEYPNWGFVTNTSADSFGWLPGCGLYHQLSSEFRRHLTISQIIGAVNAKPRWQRHRETMLGNNCRCTIEPQQETTPMSTIDTLHEAKRQRDEAAEKLETAEAVLNVALDAVRAELGEGFDLNMSGAQPDEDMSDPASWRAGDVIKAVENSIDLTEGREYVIKRLDSDGDPAVEDDSGHVEVRYQGNFTFVRRP